MPNNTPRYLSTYRTREIKFICNQAARGESLCFVGIAGSGKSNLIKFLRDDDVAKRQYLAERTDEIHFPDIDATGWDGTPESLWNMMANALGRVTDHLSPPAVSYASDPLERLEQKIEWVCQRKEHRVMFMLDEFDDVLRKGPRNVFDKLSRLRSGGNREQLSFLVFTRKLPHILGRDHKLATQSKFYDLFRYRIVALPLHNADDSRQMLKHLNAVAGYPLIREELIPIRSHTGGHARLIKVTFEVWQREKPEMGRIVESLAEQPEIQDECARILNGLHRQEREVAIRFGRGQALPSDASTVDHLRRRGLLLANDDWFSPFMGIYIRDYLS